MTKPSPTRPGKRPATPGLAPANEQIRAHYQHYLCDQQDLAGATTRNYCSDVAQFLWWSEIRWGKFESAPPRIFNLDQITTASLTRYRTYLQSDLQLRPATINRYLTSLKRFFVWAVQTGLVSYDPAQVVKMIPEEAAAPRHLTNQEEDALIAAVTVKGSVRDRVIITLLLHTGLRAGELVHLRRDQVQVQTRSGRLQVWGKRNK